MSERGVVDLIEEWQAGFFLIVGAAVAGIAVGFAAGSIAGPAGFFPGFLGGGILAFLVYAYLRYGR